MCLQVVLGKDVIEERAKNTPQPRPLVTDTAAGIWHAKSSVLRTFSALGFAKGAVPPGDPLPPCSFRIISSVFLFLLSGDVIFCPSGVCAHVEIWASILAYYHNNRDNYYLELNALAVQHAPQKLTQLLSMPAMLKRRWQSSIRGRSRSSDWMWRLDVATSDLHVRLNLTDVNSALQSSWSSGLAGRCLWRTPSFMASGVCSCIQTHK